MKAVPSWGRHDGIFPKTPPLVFRAPTTFSQTPQPPPKACGPSWVLPPRMLRGKLIPGDLCKEGAKVMPCGLVGEPVIPVRVAGKAGSEVRRGGLSHALRSYL